MPPIAGQPAIEGVRSGIDVEGRVIRYAGCVEMKHCLSGVIGKSGGNYGDIGEVEGAEVRAIADIDLGGEES